jgi:hypothetical protein
MFSISTVDTKWTQQQIGVVSQGAIMTAHTMGPTGPGSKRRPQDVTREEFIEACRTALLHRFFDPIVLIHGELQHFIFRTILLMFMQMKRHSH